MPWEGVTEMEQRENFIRDYRSGYYSITELSERFSVSRKTAYKWIDRYDQFGAQGFHEGSRRPHHSPTRTEQATRDELIVLRKRHPRWGPKKLLAILADADPKRQLPAESTVSRLLKEAGVVRRRRRPRRLHPGCPKSRADEPNDIWATDYKGQFRMGDGKYCFPLTVSDLATRYLLGCDGHEAISHDKTASYFDYLFREYGLPWRIRSDNGAPFASSALARLSRLSVWFIKLGIYPELIEPGRPEQNGIHERMHRTLKAEATIPPERCLRSQQKRFDAFREEYNTVRPHEAIGMKRPADLYRPSDRRMPKRIETYDYPANYLVRRVSRAGAIRVHHRQIFVATPLAEEYVGLEEIADGVYDVMFCFYHIGRYDEETNTLEGVISKVPMSRIKADAGWKV